MRLSPSKQRGVSVETAPDSRVQTSAVHLAAPPTMACSSPSPLDPSPTAPPGPVLTASSRLTPVLLAMLLPTFLFPAPAAEPPSAETLLHLLPDMAIHGLAPEGSPHIYTDNLFEHLNGGSGTYYDYGFRQLLVQYYRGPSAELSVEIYDMGTPLQAFGIYSSERSPQYNFIEVGAQGFRDEGILYFIAGRFYIKLSAYGQNTGPILEAAAKAIEQKIQGDKSLPSELDLLPKASRIPNSERFHPHNPLGLPALGPAFSALYRSGSAELTCFFWLPGRGSSPTESLQVLRHYFETTARVTDLAPLGPLAGEVATEKHGRVAFFNSGPLTVMCRNVPEQSIGLLASFGRETVSIGEPASSQGG